MQLISGGDRNDVGAPIFSSARPHFDPNYKHCVAFAVSHRHMQLPILRAFAHMKV